MYVCGGRGDATRLMGGIFVLSGVLLSFVSSWFLLVAAIPGIMMLLSFFTGFCPSENVMKRLGVAQWTAAPPTFDLPDRKKQ